LAIRSEIIGGKLRTLRMALGVSQTELAEKTGVSFQQVQKYEKGINRISADRLFDFAKILGVEVEEFFKGIEEGKKTKKLRLAESEQKNSLKPDIMTSKESIALLREYYKIKDIDTRKKVLDIIKKMAS